MIDEAIDSDRRVLVSFHSDTGERAAARTARVVEDLTRPADAQDIGFLRLVDGPIEAVPLILGTSSDVTDHAFGTFGFPESKPVEGLAGKAEVIGSTTEGGFRVLQLRSQEITRRFSGAPVWDGDGLVVGMVMSFIRPDQFGRLSEVAFMRPVEQILEVCPELRPIAPNPYRGLEVFEPEHAALYFGRDSAIDSLLARLLRSSTVLVVGVSGSGKSSFVRAGLARGLARPSAAPELSGRTQLVIEPGAFPLISLLTGMAQRATVSPEAIGDALQMSDFGEALRAGQSALLEARLADLPSELVARVVTELVARPLVVIDQFERVFTECTDRGRRETFFDVLAAFDAAGIKTVVALRADYYGVALAYPTFAQIILESQLTLLPMTASELLEAIETPARLHNRVFENGLPARIVAEARGGAGDLPLLEFALTQLWDLDGDRGMLTTASYDGLGYQAPDGRSYPGVRGAIAARADAVWSGLSLTEQADARRVFIELITESPADQDDMIVGAGRRAWLNEFDEAARSIAGRLVDARLLTADNIPFSNQPTIELAHDALIQAWPTLSRWVRAYRPFTLWRDRELTPLWEQWVRSGHDPDLLLRSRRLSEAATHLKEFSSELSGSRETYIRESLKAEAERDERQRAELATARRRNRVLTVLAVGLGLLALLAGGASVVAVRSSERYDAQRRIAVSQRLAEAAGQQVQRDPELALLLAREAARRSHTPQAEDALRKALASPLQSNLPGSGDAVTDIAFTRNDVAAAAVDGEARIYDLDHARLLRTIRPQLGDELALNVAAAPGLVLLAGSRGLGLWDIRTGKQTTRLEGRPPAGEPFLDELSCSITPDGSTATCVGATETRSWDARTGAVVMTPWTGRNRTPTLSSDGSRLAIAHGDQTVQVYDVARRQIAGIVQVRAGGISHIGLDQNGSRVLTVDAGGLVLVRRVATGDVVGHDRVAKDADVRLVPSGHGALFGSGNVTFWDLDTGAHTDLGVDEVDQLTPSPDGRTAVEATDTGSRLIDLHSGLRLADLPFNDATGGAYFAPRSGLILTDDNDAHIRVWKPQAQVVGRAGAASAQTAAFTRDGTEVATVDRRTVRAWNLPGGEPAGTLPVPIPGSDDDNALAEGHLAFSPDGRRLRAVVNQATVHDVELRTGADRAVHTKGYVFDVTGGGAFLVRDSITTLGVRSLASRREFHIRDRSDAPYSGISAAALSDDGKRVGVVMGAGGAEVWDTRTGLRLFKVRDRALTSVAVAPNGQRIAFADYNGDLLLWNEPAGRLRTLRDAVEGLSRARGLTEFSSMHFSTNGDLIIVQNPIRATAQIYSVATGTLIESFRSVAGVVTSPDGATLALIRDERPVVVQRCDECGSWTQLVRRADLRLRRELSRAERARFLVSP